MGSRNKKRATRESCPFPVILGEGILLITGVADRKIKPMRPGLDLPDRYKIAMSVLPILIRPAGMMRSHILIRHFHFSTPSWRE